MICGHSPFQEAKVPRGFGSVRRGGSCFLRGPAPVFPDAGDVDDDGRLSISDAIVLLLTLFQGAADRVPPPGLDCGPDPTDDRWGDCSTTGS